MADTHYHKLAAPIANAMVQVFEAVLWPEVDHYFAGCIQPLNIRVGSGKATYFRAERHANTVVIGSKMVLSKLQGEQNWLSSREIQRFGYYDGEPSLLNSFAQTLCHEFAHLIQINAFGRRYGSVHNAEFYDVLSRLHEDGLAGTVRLALHEKLLQQNIALPAITSGAKTHAAAKRSPDISKGQWIRFKYQGQWQEAKVIRLNTKTVSAKPKNASGKLAYWRIPYQLIESVY